jgi:N-acetyl-gamma-glutamyl-phosphate reductase common form
MSGPSWPVIVLGGSGYVAGELLRLVAAHPHLHLGAAVSTSQAGEPVAAAFAHLAPAYRDAKFVTIDQACARLDQAPHWLVLSAAPHGVSATIIAALLAAAEGAGVKLTAVDASADFRFRDTELFASVYGHPHPEPARNAEFSCAVPEHLPVVNTPHAAQPGCFATAMLLAIVPLLAADVAEPEFFVSAVTGSTGAGRTPRDTTHHPVRQSNLFAYQALVHRHAPEVTALAAEASGRDIALHFVPHSGPFARGIHATVFARPRGGVTRGQLHEALSEYYRDAPFVHVLGAPPKMKDIVASNHAALSVGLDAGSIAVFSVIDNLVKGAAGGAVQWANRLLGLPETAGLEQTAAGWV